MQFSTLALDTTVTMKAGWLQYESNPVTGVVPPQISVSYLG
jgi:hypothetical protein